MKKTIVSTRCCSRMPKAFYVLVSKPKGKFPIYHGFYSRMDDLLGDKKPGMLIYKYNKEQKNE